jgi:uncharacterized membrane protein required for colicin V production
MKPMQIELAFVLSLADLFLFGIVVLFAFVGFVRGVLNQLLSFLRVYFSFIAATLLYRKVAKSLLAGLSLPPWATQMIAFAGIFVIFIVTIWLIWAIMSKRISKPETSSRVSKISGTILGLAEGILMISIVIMIISFHPRYDRAQLEIKNTISYKAIEPIAPGIRSLTIGPISQLTESPDTKSNHQTESDQQ